MHRTNHPYTEHLQASVWDVDPREVCRGRPVGLAWFSPDCKHFSKAKGAALVDRNIRGLAWIVLRWAGTVRPRVIILENVEEFVTWGPVLKRKTGEEKSRTDLSKMEAGSFWSWGIRLNTGRSLRQTWERRPQEKLLCAGCSRDGRPIVWPERTPWAERQRGGTRWAADAMEKRRGDHRLERTLLLCICQ